MLAALHSISPSKAGGLDEIYSRFLHHLFFYSEHPSSGWVLFMFPSKPWVEELSRSHGIGSQFLGTRCGTSFVAGEEVRGVMKVCMAERA